MSKLTTYECYNEFIAQCKFINLSKEYPDYTGYEQWAIITDLTEQELESKFGELIKKLKPYVLLTVAQGEAIIKFHSNERKFKIRQSERGDAFSFDSGLSENYHSEIVDQIMDITEAIALKDALKRLDETQRRRFIKKYLYGFSSRQIAKEEGVNYSSVDKSINAAKENLKKFLG